MALPDFFIIGSMKCGTTTLAAQLAAQDDIFMSVPKEPSFFSNDPVFARGLGWYESLFDAARPGDLKGEASTNYTKLPTWPETVRRLQADVPNARFIYVVRDPVDRFVSHYMHDWSIRAINCSIDEAADIHPELVDYGRYAMQLRPYLDLFPSDRILVLRLEDMSADPQAAFDRVAAFLGHKGRLVWRDELGRQNVSLERIRQFPLRGFLVDNPIAATLRRALIPKVLRGTVRRHFQMPVRPELAEHTRRRLVSIFRSDMRSWPEELSPPPYTFQ